MICDCGLLDVSHHPSGARMTIVLSKGDATIRPVGVTVRVEHLDCMTCRGVLLRPGTDLFGDCGCGDKVPAVPTPASALVFPVISRSGSCSCGAMVWEDARDGALIFEGIGYYHVWDRVSDGAIVVVGGHCMTCGAFDTELEDELVSSIQAQT